MRHTAAGLLGLLLCIAWARASEGPPPVLHIATYRSPSGEYALTVDPSHLHGQGVGTYTMSRGGQTLWTRKLKFTFWEAVVTDDGVAAGYAYTHGWRGFAPKGGVAEGWGEFVVAILSGDGTPRLEERRARDSGGFHAPPDPVALGCFLDFANNRLIVRFMRLGERGDWRGERWEAYGLAVGTRGRDATLEVGAAENGNLHYYARTVQAVRGAPLALVTWTRTEWGRPRAREGVRLALVDSDAREVWSREWPDEFTGLERFSGWLIDSMDLTATEGLGPGGFSYRSYADQARLTFRVVPDPAGAGAWIVEEHARAKDAIPDPTRPVPLALPEITLEPRGVIELVDGDDGDAAPLGVHRFDIDGAGRIGFISTEEGQRDALTLMSPDGTLARRIALNLPERKNAPVADAAWITGDTWVVVRGTYDDPPVVEGFIVDAATEKVEPVERFEAPPPGMGGGLAGAGPGGFGVLGNYRDDRLAAFDPRGGLRWSVERPVFSPQAVAGDESGRIAVLGGIKPQIVIYGAGGAPSGTIDLVRSMGRGLNYVTDLAPDAEGGWILHDFNGEPPIHRLNPDGTVRAGFHPRYPDGRTFRIHGGVRRAPDGRLWTSDSAALLRLDDEGKVDHIVGRAPTAESIGEVRCLTVDHTGLIYVVDGRNASVHVFDAGGRKVRVLRPEPGDFPVDSGLGAITVAGDGGVYYRPTSTGPGETRYLRFNADGTRAGFQDPISGEVSDDWFFRPGTRERLVLGYERAWLVDEQGRKTTTLERRADRKWLDKVQQAAVAPDGSFAVTSHASEGLFGGPPCLTVFAPDGEPRRTLDLAGEYSYARVSFNGRIACVASGTRLILFDAETGATRGFSIPGAAENSWWTPHGSPDGHEVWLHDSQARRLVRYKLPESIPAP